MPVRDYILALVTLVSLALPVSGMAQLAPELLDKQGFPRPEILDNDLKTSHCFFLPEGWTPNAAGSAWVDDEGTAVYAPNAATCLSYIRLGIAGLSTGPNSLIRPGSIFYDNKTGQKSICHIVDANSSVKIPDVIVKSFAHGEQKNWAGDMLKQTILYLMSLPEVLKYLDEAMPLECKQLTS